MVHCCIPKCRSHAGRAGFEDVTFHRIPADPARRSQWLAVIYRRNWQPAKNAVVCSIHFPPEDFEAWTEFGKNRRLRVTASPSIFLGEEDYVPPPKRKKIKIVNIVSNAPSEAEAVDGLDGESWDAPIESKPVIIRAAQPAGVPISGNPRGSTIVTRYVRLERVGNVGPRIVSSGSLAVGAGGGLSSGVGSSSGGVINSSDVTSLQNEVETLKKCLSESQMKNLNLVYEKKVMKKERDNFEKLLSDAEAKTFEGDRIKSDLSDILDRPFENVEELKNSIRDLLSGNQILPDFF